MTARQAPSGVLSSENLTPARDDSAEAETHRFAAWIAITSAYIRAGMFEHAATAVTVARHLQPVDAEVEYHLGLIEEAQGAMRPPTPLGGASPGGAQGGVASPPRGGAQGGVASQSGQTPGARARYSRAVAIQPTHAGALRKLAASSPDG